jgi:4-hydroxy-3-methylbut-2-en-1-yl diphosphate reductase
VQIERAREMGFCFGVRRAIKLLEQAAQQHGTIESLGAVVHNRQVVNHLAALGVKVVDNTDQIKGTVVAIPSHGLGLPQLEKLKSEVSTVVDATCPFVRRAQLAARKLAQSGFQIVIFGDAEHAEVKAILSSCEGCGIVTTKSDIVFTEPPRRLGVLSQTTQSPERFGQFVKELLDRIIVNLDELRVINTICDATRERQTAARELASHADIILVVGDLNSANTRRLAELCAGDGVETHLVEDANQVDPIWFKNKKHVGVTAGASTPDEIIDLVINKLQNLMRG